MSDCCCGKNKMVLSCSGAADVGELADRVSRKISKETDIKMGCLAGVGGNISGFIVSAKDSDYLLAIDGCPVSCAKKTLLTHGVEKFDHIVVTEFGFVKGKTQVNDESINKVYEHARKISTKA